MAPVTYEQGDVVAVRDLLIDGLLHDMTRIAEGARCPRWVKARSATYCAARGLCRKDFWT